MTLFTVSRFWRRCAHVYLPYHQSGSLASPFLWIYNERRIFNGILALALLLVKKNKISIDVYWKESLVKEKRNICLKIFTSSLMSILKKKILMAPIWKKDLMEEEKKIYFKPLTYHCCRCIPVPERRL